NHALRNAISIVALVSWFLASNHCALGGVRAKNTGSSHCHEHCAGHASGHKSNHDILCCKSLQPVFTGQGKKLSGYDEHHYRLQSYFVLACYIFAQMELPASEGELDTGPPFASSFAESVLQRSILAHAPPSRA